MKASANGIGYCCGRERTLLVHLKQDILNLPFDIDMVFCIVKAIVVSWMRTRNSQDPLSDKTRALWKTGTDWLENLRADLPVKYCRENGHYYWKPIWTKNRAQNSYGHESFAEQIRYNLVKFRVPKFYKR